MKELNIRIEYPDKYKSKEVLDAVRDYLIELTSALGGRIAYRVEDIKDDNNLRIYSKDNKNNKYFIINY